MSGSFRTHSLAGLGKRKRIKGENDLRWMGHVPFLRSPFYPLLILSRPLCSRPPRRRRPRRSHFHTPMFSAPCYHPSLLQPLVMNVDVDIDIDAFAAVYAGPQIHDGVLLSRFFSSRILSPVYSRKWLTHRRAGIQVDSVSCNTAHPSDLESLS